MTKFVVVLLALCAVWAALEAATDRWPSRATAYGMAVAVAGIWGGERDGTTIHISGGSALIDKECSALPYGVLFLFALIAYPAPWRRRVAALAAGLPALFLLDFLRLTVLIVLHGSPAYSAVHALAGVAFVAVLLVGWIAWTRWAGGPFRMSLRHPAVATAVVCTFIVGLVDAVFAQGPPPPPPPPPPVPLGGVEFALAGLVGVALLRRRTRESS